MDRTVLQKYRENLWGSTGFLLSLHFINRKRICCRTLLERGTKALLKKTLSPKMYLVNKYVFPFASLAWEQEAPIVKSIDRLSIESWDDSPHISASTVQDHASTLLLLKMSRYSYQVKLHLHSIHNFFVCHSENTWNYLKSKLLGNESVLNEVHKRFVLHRPQYSTMTYYVTQQLYWIVMNIAKFSAHTPLTGRKSFLISVFNFKTCKTKLNVFIMYGLQVKSDKRLYFAWRDIMRILFW